MPDALHTVPQNLTLSQNPKTAASKKEKRNLSALSRKNAGERYSKNKKGECSW